MGADEGGFELGQVDVDDEVVVLLGVLGGFRVGDEVKLVLVDE